ncbi:hypothetical protein Gogos_008537 [Gossypium gossypioides]|uniref:Uncharacterized protein n=1 Tax=Gossypium gossypioides TaxID=34282 RepID=A0A7J9CBR3_GOSGO|nr:hypothetical protein [Gossypium gossypioides]
MSYRQRGNNHQLSYYRQRTTHPKPEPLPAWEKKLCIKVGAMPWEIFVEAKKNLYENDKVLEWDDSTRLTTFQKANAMGNIYTNSSLLKFKLPKVM